MKAEFDIAAATYDDDFTRSSIGQMQRNLVWKYLNGLLIAQEPIKILELNCGTGEDAIRLAKNGNTVIATDISEGMLNIARSKAKSSNVHFQKLDINRIDKYTFDTEFDLVFSNFGGLNCLDNEVITKLGVSISKLLRKNGKFVAVVMPDKCIWESFYFVMKRDFEKAFRRSKNFAMANVSGKLVKTYYYSPSNFNDLIGENFRRKMLKPIGFFIPPSYLESFFKNWPKWLNMLCWLDMRCAVFAWLAPFSDHYYIQFTKR